MNRVLAAVFASFVLTGCFDLEVPPTPPPPAPGTLQGTLVWAVPGRPDFQPAKGATVELLHTGLVTTAGDDGRFVLGGVVQTSGQLLLAFDADGDGAVDRQRLFSLDGLGMGPGRDLSLGQLVLSRNGSVEGKVTLTGAVASGHGGITVFVPGGPWATYTADDGSYRLEGLPEGALQVAFFKTGFEVSSLDTTLGAGEDRLLPPVRLKAQADGPASLTAKVLTAAQTPATDAKVTLRHLRTDRRLSVRTDGVVSESSLTAGVYSLSFERAGAFPIALYNVAFPPGETNLGTITLLDGPGGSVMLGGLGPWGGPSDAGLDAGMDAGTDAGVDAGTDAGTDAGVDAGTDAGAPPVAIATAPAFATAGSQVTLSGMSSTGDFPLTYRWTQLSGPMVTLSVNNTPLAHSPRFTAPAAGNVLDFQLVVEDRLGFSSAPAPVRVGIGSPPLARFTPDSGVTVYGSQLVQLTSTSFDDAGIALVAFDWQLATGSGGTLITDGGASALWRAPAVAFGAPSVLGGVSLQVTSAIGARSNVATNYYSVQGINPDNWSIDAGPSQNVLVGPTPPQVTMPATVTSLISMPQYALSWSCSPGLTLVGGDTLAPRFIAPVIVGPTQTKTCQVTATGQPPLDPLTVTDSLDLFLQDDTAPSLVRTSVEATRVGRFGVVLTANEPLSSATVSSNCFGPMATRILNRSVIAGHSTMYADGMLCGGFTTTIGDRAQATKSSTIPFGSGADVPVQTVWSGPYESTTTFDDPRPVLASLGQLYKDQQELFGVTPGSPQGFELVATQAGDLVRFTGLDPTTRPTCEPSCPLASTQQALALTPGQLPTISRAFYGGAELFVTTSTDGGVPVTARRSPTGTWTKWEGLPGFPGNWANNFVAAHYEPDGGQILVDGFTPSTGTFTAIELAASGVATPSLLSTGEDFVVAAVGPTRQLFVRKRTSPLNWSTITQVTPPQNLTSLRVATTPSGIAMAVYESPAGFSMQRIDSASYPNYLISAAPVVGFDFTGWAGQFFVVYALNGDIRLRWVGASQLAGGGSFQDFPGPPRTGFTAPYPTVLDGNPLCEAAYPSFAFLEEHLVITWQERCAPATQWKVMARALR